MPNYISEKCHKLENLRGESELKLGTQKDQKGRQVLGK